MTVYVNAKAFDAKASQKLEEILSAAGIPVQRGVAIAVNNTVIPKSEWEKVSLKENDKIIIIKATQGG